MVSDQRSAVSKQLKTESTKVDFNFYLITDRKQIERETHLISSVSKALAGGVRAVQLREKDLETRELLKLAKRMRETTSRYRAKLFVNDRCDVALAAGADGVHLTQKSMPADAARKVCGKRMIIGVSTHSLKEAQEAENGGADFITLGPVYRTLSKLKYGEPLGLKKFRYICREMSIPVFGLGGIKGDNIKDVMNAGASGVSMISEIFGAADIRKSSMKINQIINKEV